MNKSWIWTGLAGLLIGLIIACIIYCRQSSKLKELSTAYDAINSELVITKNKLGQEVAKSQVIVLENEKMFLKIQSKDSNIIQLQNLVKREKSINKKLQDAIILKQTIIANYQDTLKNLISGYQEIKDSLGNIVRYPIYNRKIDMFGKWITGNVKLGYSKFDIDIKTVSEYEITIGEERDNIFKPYKTYATVTNLNPYDHTTALKVYSKNSLKPKRFSLGIFLGAGYDFYHATAGPIIGVGVGWTPIRF